MKRIFYSDRMPTPQGPYSQAVIHNNVLYTSGQIPLRHETGQVVRGSIEEETEAVLENLKIIVEDAGATMDDVLKVTCYLADMDDFERFNGVYKRYFPHRPPARTTIQAGKLPFDVQIEMDAIVALPKRLAEKK
ncbi:MAG: RidA family protein [Thermodesulfovibrionia bacterium]